MVRFRIDQQLSGGTVLARIAIWIALGMACDLRMGGSAAAQTLQGGVQQNEPPPTTQVVVPPAEPAPDLRKYLLPGGRYIDRCRYWHDHPDADTLLYGQPDHFPPGRIGETRSVNGRPAPYGRCAVDPCYPYGYICWHDPAAQGPPPSPNAAAYNMLREKGCTVGGGGKINCPTPRPGPPSDARTPGGYDPCSNPARPPSCPDQQPLTATVRTNSCRLMPNGNIDCSTGGGAPGPSGSADSHGDVPNQGSNTAEGTGTQATGGTDAGVPYTPLPKDGQRLQGGAEVAGGPELIGETYEFGHKLSITIVAGWPENHEVKGQIQPHKDRKGRSIPDYFGEAEGTVGIKRDSQGNLLRDGLGNPLYYFNLRSLTVRATNQQLIRNGTVEIALHTVFKGY